MTREDFDSFVRRYNALWNVTFGDEKIKVWYDSLKGLKIKGLLDTLTSLATIKDRPSIKDIVEEYDRFKRLQYERNFEKQQLYIQEAVADQGQCPICDNRGFIIYDKYYGNAGPYPTYLRCTCLRGKDQNRHSEYQITKDKLWYNPLKKKKESLYIPDISDVMTDEEIAIIKLKNEQRKQETKFDSDMAVSISAMAKKFSTI